MEETDDLVDEQPNADRPPRDPQRYATSDGRAPAPGLEGYDSKAPQPINPETGQHRAYWVLSDEERAKGFVRPVRRSYRHATCGTNTRMGQKIAETYAREPRFYGSTFCVECQGHFPVGPEGEFFWLDESDQLTEERVGT